MNKEMLRVMKGIVPFLVPKSLKWSSAGETFEPPGPRSKRSMICRMEWNAPQSSAPLGYRIVSSFAIETSHFSEDKKCPPRLQSPKSWIVTSTSSFSIEVVSNLWKTKVWRYSDENVVFVSVVIVTHRVLSDFIARRYGATVEPHQPMAEPLFACATWTNLENDQPHTHHNVSGRAPTKSRQSRLVCNQLLRKRSSERGRFPSVLLCCVCKAHVNPA